MLSKISLSAIQFYQNSYRQRRDFVVHTGYLTILMDAQEA